MSLPTLYSTILAAGISLVSASALAQSANAEALFLEGRAAMARGEYKTACSRFSESHRIEPAVGTRLNVALCKEKLGLLLESIGHYQAVIEKLDASDRRHGIAKRSVKSLQARLAQLTIRFAPGAPPGTQVIRNGVVVTSSQIGVATKVDPGKHDFQVTAPGYQGQRVTLTLAAGGTEEVALSPGAPGASVLDGVDGVTDGSVKTASHQVTPDGAAQPQAGATLASTTLAGDELGSEATGGWQRPAGYVAGGIGIASLIVGGVTGAMTLDKKAVLDANTNPDGTCNAVGCAAADSGRTLLAVTIASLAAGVVGTGLGAYWLITADDGSTTSTTVGAAPMPSGGAVFVSGTF